MIHIPVQHNSSHLQYCVLHHIDKSMRSYIRHFQIDAIMFMFSNSKLTVDQVNDAMKDLEPQQNKRSITFKQHGESTKDSNG